MFSNSFGMGFGFMWIFWILVIIAIIWVVKTMLSNSDTDKEKRSKYSAIEVLKMRYARGEINKEEFQQMRKDLEK